MMYKVGTKGQVVIPKEIRDKLGVKPGWIALHRLVDGHVQIDFIPPPHRRSLKGILAPRIKVHLPDTHEAWDKAREMAWDDAVKGEYGQEEDAE